TRPTSSNSGSPTPPCGEVKPNLLTVLGLLLVAATPAAPQRVAKRSPALAAAIDQDPRGGKLVAWVFFADKGAGADARAAAARAPMTPRAASRRRLRGQIAGVTVEDLPLVSAYVDKVAGSVNRVRQRSRWLNAVSVEATAAQLDAIEALPFVARLDLVRRYRRREDEAPQPEPEASARSRTRARARAATAP